MMDDRGDHRPGAQAAKEYNVQAPLDAADLSKDEIRTLQTPWIANVEQTLVRLSVIPLYGLAITEEKLSTVEQAEQFLRDKGIRVFRVRHHDNIARVEVLPEDMPQLVQEPFRSEMVSRFKELGYTYVTMDLAGFRSGSMNEGSQSQLVSLSVEPR